MHRREKGKKYRDDSRSSETNELIVNRTSRLRGHESCQGAMTRVERPHRVERAGATNQRRQPDHSGCRNAVPFCCQLGESRPTSIGLPQIVSSVLIRFLETTMPSPSQRVSSRRFTSPTSREISVQSEVLLCVSCARVDDRRSYD